MKKPVILLVEDNADDEALTMRALRKKNNITNEIVVARDGAEALDYLFGQGAHRAGDRYAAGLDTARFEAPKGGRFRSVEEIRSDKPTDCCPWLS